MRGRMPRAIVVPNLKPYAKELLYIESTGTQHIDTLFKPNQNTRVVMEASLTATPTATEQFFGSRHDTNGTNAYMFFWYNGGKTLRAHYGEATGAGLLEWSVAAATDRVTVDFNKNVVTVNGVTLTAGEKTFQNAYNMTLLARNTADSIVNKAKARLYSCKIYDNGTLIRDFIPVLDADGVACLYDKVGRKLYYNAGTGSFTYAMAVGYIESSGTQYIDTEFAPNQDTRVVMDVQTSGVTSMKGLFGCRNAASPTASLAFMVWQSASTTCRSDYFGTNATATGTFDGRMTVDMNKNVCTINGVTVENTYKTAQATLSMYLLACNNSGTATSSYRASAKLHACQLYDNDILIRDYVPAVTSDGVAFLFDRVNKKNYLNAGDGTFSYGGEAA